MNRRTLALSLLLVTLLSAWPAARVSAQPASGLEGTTLGPGESVQVAARFWCLDFGEPFPEAISGPIGRTWPPIANLLQIAAGRGVVTTDPYQVQLAIWRITNGAYHYVPGQDDAVARDLVTGAFSVAPLPTPTRAVLIGTAGAGALQVTVENFQATAGRVPDNGLPYSGTGMLVVENTGTATITFTVTGAVFTPAEQRQGQYMVAEQVATAPVTSTAAPSSAPVPGTGQPEATPSAAGTAWPGVASQGTPVAPILGGSETVEPTGTPRILPSTGAGAAGFWPAVVLGAGGLALLAGWMLKLERWKR